MKDDKILKPLRFLRLTCGVPPTAHSSDTASLTERQREGPRKKRNFLKEQLKVLFLKEDNIPCCGKCERPPRTILFIAKSPLDLLFGEIFVHCLFSCASGNQHTTTGFTLNFR
ncbi:hypothetical protein XENOCAPTIV_005581 [Xenoophorus captivus]|uniref:Uncharacterized protein n=1 Tax=Xenoophorus captivus TaxID=1517983 RepID=A0ABV0Q872_9TELE